MVLRFLLLSAGLWRSISQFWGILNANITFLSRCTAEAGSAFLSCLLQPFRLTFTRSRLAGGSWWLPGVTLSFGHCRSDHIKRAGPGQGQKDASPPGSAFKEGFRVASVQKQPGSSRSAWKSRMPVFGSVWPSSFLSAPSSCPTLPPPWTRGHCRA